MSRLAYVSKVSVQGILKFRQSLSVGEAIKKIILTSKHVDSKFRAVTLTRQKYEINQCEYEFYKQVYLSLWL